MKRIRTEEVQIDWCIVFKSNSLNTIRAQLTKSRIKMNYLYQTFCGFSKFNHFVELITFRNVSFPSAFSAKTNKTVYADGHLSFFVEKGHLVVCFLFVLVVLLCTTKKFCDAERKGLKFPGYCFGVFFKRFFFPFGLGFDFHLLVMDLFNEIGFLTSANFPSNFVPSSKASIKKISLKQNLLKTFTSCCWNKKWFCLFFLYFF